MQMHFVFLVEDCWTANWK